MHLPHLGRAILSDIDLVLTTDHWLWIIAFQSDTVQWDVGGRPAVISSEQEQISQPTVQG